MYCPSGAGPSGAGALRSSGSAIRMPGTLPPLLYEKEVNKISGKRSAGQSVLLSGVDKVDWNRPGKEEATTGEDALYGRGM